MTIITRNNINVATLGDARAVLKMEAENAALPLGTIYGIATKAKTTSGMDKAGNETTFERIVGSFEAIPATPREETIDQKKVKVAGYTSASVFLPDGISERLTQSLNTADGESVTFGYRFTAVKNGKGFQLKVEQVLAPTVLDPLSAVRTAMANHKSK